MEKSWAKYSLISSNRLCFLAVVMCFRDGCTASCMGNIFQAQIYYVKFEGRHEMVYRSTGELGASKSSGSCGWSLKKWTAH